MCSTVKVNDVFCSSSGTRTDSEEDLHQLGQRSADQGEPQRLPISRGLTVIVSMLPAVYIYIIYIFRWLVSTVWGSSSCVQIKQLHIDLRLVPLQRRIRDAL